MSIIDRIRESLGVDLAAELEQVNTEAEQVIEIARRATELRIACAQRRVEADRILIAQLRANTAGRALRSQPRRVPIPGNTADERFTFIANHRDRYRRGGHVSASHQGVEPNRSRERITK